MSQVMDEMAGKDLETIISEGTTMFAKVLLCALQLISSCLG